MASLSGNHLICQLCNLEIKNAITVLECTHKFHPVCIHGHWAITDLVCPECFPQGERFDGENLGIDPSLHIKTMKDCAKLHGKNVASLFKKGKIPTLAQLIQTNSPVTMIVGYGYTAEDFIKEGINIETWINASYPLEAWKLLGFEYRHLQTMDPSGKMLHLLPAEFLNSLGIKTKNIKKNPTVAGLIIP